MGIRFLRSIAAEKALAALTSIYTYNMVQCQIQLKAKVYL